MPARVGPVGTGSGDATLNAPATFSIVNNCEQMTDFFKRLNRLLKRGQRVFLNLRNITSLTPDAIIYMLHQFEYYELKYGKAVISGNYPDDSTAKLLLEQSGFLSLIGAVKDRAKGVTGTVFAVENGTDVDNIIASQLRAFMLTSLKIAPGKASRGVYSTLIESMGNTHNHAFINGNNRLPKWFVLAQYSADMNMVEFAFLDGGAGIPFTVRTNHTEKARKLFPGTWGNADARLVVSALQGEFRSRTMQTNRGKGLPRIRKLSDGGHIQDLVIVSNRAYVVPGRKLQQDMSNKFYGTLICWKVKPIVVKSPSENH